MSSGKIDFDTDCWNKRRIIEVNGRWTVEGRPRAEYMLLHIARPSNVPGKAFIAFLVTVPPRAATPPHTHNGAAVYAQVIQGKMISQMIHEDHQGKHDSGVNVYGAGEMWYEQPGCRHVRVENPSDDEPAQFFANFIIDEDKISSDDVANLLQTVTILDVESRSPYYSRA